MLMKLTHGDTTNVNILNNFESNFLLSKQVFLIVTMNRYCNHRSKNIFTNQFNDVGSI